MTVRTRLAPSPTGFMHIGNFRTALYAFLLARHNNGQFILRIEDTDQKREVEGAYDAIINSLKWAGLNYNEGPDIGGPHGPYIQSQRLDLYRKYADQLLEAGNAYYCFCDKETLEKMREEQIAQKLPPKYDKRCCKLPAEEVQAKLSRGESHVIRLKVPEDRVVAFTDLIRGNVSYHTKEIDDQVLIKSDGYPTYHLAVVVDDHLMEISHVIRGEEWLSSTPKHVLLYEYLGWQAPAFVHLSLILNADRSKLSKRQGDVAVEDYIKKGYLKETIINFVAFLGWNPGDEREIFSLDELIKEFDLAKVHKAGAIFNIDKLNWYNSYYIKNRPTNELVALVKELYPEWANKAEEMVGLDKVIELFKERLNNLLELQEKSEFLLTDDLVYEKELLNWKQNNFEQTKNYLQAVYDKLADSDFTDIKLLEQGIISWIKEQNWGNGDVLWPLRVSLSGQKNSPSPFEIMGALGREKSLERIKKSIELLK